MLRGECQPASTGTRSQYESGMWECGRGDMLHADCGHAPLNPAAAAVRAAHHCGGTALKALQTLEITQYDDIAQLVSARHR